MVMDFLRRSTRCSRLEIIRNNVIREKMSIKNSVLDYIRFKQLNTYGHMQRMDQERLLRRIFRMVPTRKMKKGKTSKFEEVTTGMRELEIGDLEWVDRKGWRNKVNLL